MPTKSRSLIWSTAKQRVWVSFVLHASKKWNDKCTIKWGLATDPGYPNSGLTVSVNVRESYWHLVTSSGCVAAEIWIADLPQGAVSTEWHLLFHLKGCKGWHAFDTCISLETGWVCCGGKRAGGPREKKMQRYLAQPGVSRRSVWNEMDKDGQSGVKLAWLWHSFGLLWQVWQLREAGLEPILDTLARWIQVKLANPMARLSLHLVSFCHNNLDTFLQLLHDVTRVTSVWHEIAPLRAILFQSVAWCRKFWDAGRTQWKQP